MARAGTITGAVFFFGGASELTASHISKMPALCDGSMLYCRLYKLFRLIGGTNLPVTRHSRTRGDK